MVEKTIKIHDPEQISDLFGNCDVNINAIQKKYNVYIVTRGSEMKIIGEEKSVEQAINAINTINSLYKKGEKTSEHTVRYVSSMIADGADEELKSLVADSICLTSSGKPVRPRTVGQQKYINAIKEKTIIIGVGPAGTGKTYLAVAMAVKSFKAHEINKIILTRPAVEAGESLGFLPGDLQDKVDPYLRPLYDGLFELFGAEVFQKHMERGSIEVAPLAYMRGRTLDNAFIILDEAQNTTPEQIKMFLTRLGENSKMVITGDITQIDLPSSKKSGLIEAMKVLKNIEDISIQKFTDKDVVRHKLVQEIVNAYEKYNEEGKKNKNG
jgi:phosphate starvation-inducible protein PhoH and related proteins